MTVVEFHSDFGVVIIRIDFLFLWTPSVEGYWLTLTGFSLTSGVGIDGNVPYHTQKLQIITLGQFLDTKTIPTS